MWNYRAQSRTFKKVWLERDFLGKIEDKRTFCRIVETLGFLALAVELLAAAPPASRVFLWLGVGLAGFIREIFLYEKFVDHRLAFYMKQISQEMNLQFLLVRHQYLLFFLRGWCLHKGEQDILAYLQHSLGKVRRLNQEMRHLEDKAASFEEIARHLNSEMEQLDPKLLSGEIAAWNKIVSDLNGGKIGINKVLVLFGELHHKVLQREKPIVRRLHSPPESTTRPRKERRAPDPEVRKPGPEVFLTIDSVESRFNVGNLLPDSLDKDMARNILLELMDLGGRKTAFGESYRAEDTLKRMVVRRYTRTKSQFDPRSFSRTVRWLRNEGVLCSKNKTDEEVFSLSPKPSSASNRKSAELIREVVRFYNSVSSPG